MGTTITFRRTRQVKEFESATLELTTTVEKPPEDIAAEIEKLELIVDDELDSYIAKNRPSYINGEEEIPL